MICSRSCSSTPQIPRQYTRRRLDMESEQADSKQAKTTHLLDVQLLPETSFGETEDGNLENAGEIVGRKPTIEGRRIVDFNFFLNKIKEINNHNTAMGCTISNVEIMSEHLFGFRTNILLKCNMCNITFNLKSANPDDDKMDINTASVAGAMAIGIGFSQLQELFCTMEIPCMSYKTYDKYHDKVSDAWEETALHEMEIAAREEIEHAITEGSVSPDGVPILTVVADGSWAKRSYRTNYNSLAGVVSNAVYINSRLTFHVPLMLLCTQNNCI